MIVINKEIMLTCFFIYIFYLIKDYNMLKKNILKNIICYDNSYFYCDFIICLSIRETLTCWRKKGMSKTMIVINNAICFSIHFFYLGEEYSMLMKKNMINDTTCYDESYYHCDPIACLSIRWDYDMLKKKCVSKETIVINK